MINNELNTIFCLKISFMNFNKEALQGIIPKFWKQRIFILFSYSFLI